MTKLIVGDAVGKSVGYSVGDSVGVGVGFAEGVGVGAADGTGDGAADGTGVGSADGAPVGAVTHLPRGSSPLGNPPVSGLYLTNRLRQSVRAFSHTLVFSQSLLLQQSCPSLHGPHFKPQPWHAPLLVHEW